MKKGSTSTSKEKRESANDCAQSRPMHCRRERPLSCGSVPSDFSRAGRSRLHYRFAGMIGSRSGFSRAGLLVGLALGHDGGAETVAQVVGKLVKLGVAVNLDGLLGSVANHVAVVAPSQMVFQFGFGAVVQDAVQVVG